MMRLTLDSSWTPFNRGSYALQRNTGCLTTILSEWILTWEPLLYFGICSTTLLLQDNYRIYDFVGRDPNRSPHGRTFYRNPNVPQMYLPSPDLLRDHFHQCLLRHVKSDGECHESQRHFDPDIDLGQGGFNLSTGSWWSSSEGKKQLEAELAGRLWGFTSKNRVSLVGIDAVQRESHQDSILDSSPHSRSSSN